MIELPSFAVLLFRVLLVIIIGGAIGAEREYRSKSAGFRTMILICLGSFLFTTFSIFITDNSPDRIASNIVTGIGFLGAGVIYRSDNRINGITTAATIWATAALGMGIAVGQYVIVVVGAIIVLAALYLFTRLEKWFDVIHQSRTYVIKSIYRHEDLHQFETLFLQHGMRFTRLQQNRSGEHITGSWIVQGKAKAHDGLIAAILKHSGVQEFTF